jgi:NADPH:quinone reductase-like Zn-dependent oxidoreductase
MRTITQTTVGGPEVLTITEAAVPAPGVGEIRIAVKAAGVNPVDAAVRAGFFPLLGEPPFTVGWDVAGVVDAVGADVDAFSVGDRVFGLPRFPGAASAYSEYVVGAANEVVSTPEQIDDIHAAALPMVGLTAYQAIVEIADVQAGQRVLVQGAGGGVGHIAVQLAKARGAYVVATVSARKRAFVDGLGADETIEPLTAGSPVGIEPVDAALDPFGGDNTIPTLRAIRDGGVLASLQDFDDAARAEAERRGIRLVRVMVAPSQTSLTALAELVERGLLVTHVSATFPLEEASDAHAALAASPAGKIVLVP